MIKVEVISKLDGFFDMKVSGHADPRTCAAVSALMQSSINHMIEMENEDPEAIQVEKWEEKQ